MHGNNVLLQVRRTHPYRQIELSGMETPHMNNTGNMAIVHYVVLRKTEEMEIQTVMKRNEEGRRSSSSVFFHRTFSYFYKFLLVNF